MKKYLVIERYHDEGSQRASLAQYEENGMMMPEGVTYLNGGLTTNVVRGDSPCFTILESKSDDLVMEWVKKWSGFAEFEVLRLNEKA